MESFPARQPGPLRSLPTMAAVPETEGIEFLGVTFVGHPRAGYLTFCDDVRRGTEIDETFASTVLVPDDLAETLATSWPSATLVRVDDPRALFIDTLEYLQRNNLLNASSLLPKAPTIAPDARIGAGTVIEAGVQIDEAVTIGYGTVIHANTWLKRGATIGDNCTIGATGPIVCIGKDGRRRGFPHLAGVIVGEGTIFGSGLDVQRGILTSTQIGRDSILGSLCVLGHGVEVGDDVWMSGRIGVGGHTRIENGVTIAAGCGIRDNICIGARAQIAGCSVVTKSIPADTSVMGHPARPTTRPLKAGPTR